MEEGGRGGRKMKPGSALPDKTLSELYAQAHKKAREGGKRDALFSLRGQNTDAQREYGNIYVCTFRYMYMLLLKE